MVNHRTASPLHRLQSSLHRLEERVRGRQASQSLVRLRQSLAPALVPPPPLDKIIVRIAAKQVGNRAGLLLGSLAMTYSAKNTGVVWAVGNAVQLLQLADLVVQVFAIIQDLKTEANKRNKAQQLAAHIKELP